MTVSIRRAAPLDASAILKLCTRMHNEAGENTGGVLPQPDLDQALAVIVGVIKDGFAFVAVNGDNRRAVGSIGAFPAAHWWTQDTALHEAWWYVLPEHRQSGAGVRLMQALLERARDMDLRLSMYGIGGVEREAALRRLMGRLGLKAIGTTFIQE